MVYNKIYLVFIISITAAQYLAPNVGQVPQFCNIPLSNEPLDYHKLSGVWYSIFDGKSLEDYKCLQIEIQPFEKGDTHFIINFKHGFRMDKEDSPFLFDDEQLLVFDVN